MANKMLIDTTHPEETRVVVVRGNRVEEFDFESASRKQLRGNIYLAKVTRVEPSLQAAFVDYGGNRHGFLAFSEIHPDYYQIPVADRQALIAEEERAHRDAEAELDRRSSRRSRHKAQGARGNARKSQDLQPAAEASESAEAMAEAEAAAEPDVEARAPGEAGEAELETSAGEETNRADDNGDDDDGEDDNGEDTNRENERDDEDVEAESEDANGADEAADAAVAAADDNGAAARRENGDEEAGEEEVIESVGGADALEEVQERMPRLRRQYKIQEVIKRRQIMLVQVVKEERGTKGAALTTYLSLAGRYSVLMPNTARGGGISRKITQPTDRKRLKEVAQELEVPEGMGVILRTAGASRTKTEIKRDFEYLLRLWESVRDLTLKSTAPALVYEEGSLIKRSIRDLYSKDIDEILVAGDEGHKEARDFMRMLMPSHAKNVKLYKDPQPVFSRYGVESQLDAMFTPVMQLRSGGYIVLNQAEALVAIDVNSGRATREHHIEDTALKTNLEAAEEIARQLRLRDLAGLIVIDFIDMDEKRNNRAVERRLKECLKHDRARIQVGRISHFGLLEMSRQRIRSSVLESSTEKCPHCGGMGHMRSVASVSLHLLRMLEEMLLKGATHNLVVRTRSEVALYVLNHKRAHLRDLEERFRITITVNADAAIGGAQPFVIEKGEQVHTVEAARALAVQPMSVAPPPEETAEEEEAFAEEETEAAGEAPRPESAQEREEREDREDGGRRRRRRRRRGRRGEGREPGEFTSETVAEHAVAHGEDFEDEEEPRGDGEDAESVAAREATGEGDRRRRRRGRRGGRRHREGREPQAAGGPAEDTQPEIEPEVADAVADFGGPVAASTSAEEPPPVEPRDQAPLDVPAAYEPPAPETPAPRRRSTVREPAPLFGAAEAAPMARPVEPAPPPVEAAPEPVAEPEAEPRQPRRTGWWRRRG